MEQGDAPVTTKENEKIQGDLKESKETKEDEKEMTKKKLSTLELLKEKFTKERIKNYLSNYLIKDVLLSIMVGYALHSYLVWPYVWPWSGNRGTQTRDPYIAQLAIAASPMRLQALAEAEELNYIILKNWTNFAQEALSKPKEEFVDNELKSYEHYLPLVQEYLSAYEESTGRIKILQKPGDVKVNETVEKAIIVSGNPIATFLMLRRFAFQLNKLKYPQHNDPSFNCSTFHSQFTSLFYSLGWPSEKATEECAQRILRLHHVYNFTAADISNGKFGTIQTIFSLPLSASYQIAKVALDNSWYTLAVEWFQFVIAQSKLTNDPENQNMTINAEQLLLETINKHDADWTPAVFNDVMNQGVQQYYFEEKLNESSEAIPRRTSWYKLGTDDRSLPKSQPLYWRLCSGESYITEEEKKELFCWYETKVHLTWTIRPLKMEFLSKHPVIVRIYDAISDRMIETIKNKSLATLFPSRTVVSESTEAVTVKVRSSVQAWLRDLTDPQLIPISQSVSRMTGFDLKAWSAQEQLQVLSYAFGGHYVIHKDALILNNIIEINGDRLATFFYYLSDVEAGGHTAFTVAGVAVEPIKGSAIYWYNVDTDMGVDMNSFHGGCPVIIGRKWAANKWIRYYDQMFTRKCSLMVKEKYTALVNGVEM